MMNRAVWFKYVLISLAIAAGALSRSFAVDLLPADRPLPEVIDYYVDAKIKAAGVDPAPQADDATLARRLMLDLAGRIPTSEEAQSYLASKEPQKRAQLIDRLVDSPWFVRHSASEYNSMLKGGNGSGPDLRPYLLAAMRENRPWDRMFRELLGEEADTNGAEQFVSKRLSDPDLLTRDTSSILFGINLSCCQCHKHPYVKTLTQDYFFGMKNFFARSYDFQGSLREKQFGPAKIEYKAKSGKPKEVGLMFISGAVVDAPEPNVRDLTRAMQEENKRIEELKKNFEKVKEFPPEPFFSLRRQLVKTAELPENQLLIARSIVNRLWYRFYGYGLVMRVDQMHSENPPNHPELLQWLAQDLIAHKWDLRRLAKGLAGSQAYSRSSRWDGGSKAPPQELFAVANLRPLTPMQFGVSVLLMANSEFTSAKDSPEALEKKIEKLEQSAQTNFATIIDQPGEGFQINVNESLGMSNDSERLKLIGGPLGSQLAKLSNRSQQVETAVWSVLGRPPEMSEMGPLSHYLEWHSTLAENDRARQAQVAGDQRVLIENAKSRVAAIQAELKALKPAETLAQNAVPKEGAAAIPEAPQPAAEAVEKEKLRAKLTAELAEATKLASAPLPPIPTEITSRTALNELVWALVTTPEFRFNH